RHGDLLAALDRLLTASATLSTGIGGQPAIPVTRFADSRTHHLTERGAYHALHLASAVAACATLDRGTGLGTVAVTMLAAIDRLEGDIDHAADGGFEQRHLDGHGDIPAERRPRASRERAARAEERVNRSPIEPKPSKLGA